VTNWHVSDEISLPYHRYIVFQVGDLKVTRFTYHKPKRPNWEAYQEGLKANLRVIPRVTNSVLDVKLAVDMLQQDILSTYHQNCPAWVAPWVVPWWYKEWNHLKTLTRWLLIKPK
jgi:hypothetical protein